MIPVLRIYVALAWATFTALWVFTEQYYNIVCVYKWTHNNSIAYRPRRTQFNIVQI